MSDFPKITSADGTLTAVVTDQNTVKLPIVHVSRDPVFSDFDGLQNALCFVDAYTYISLFPAPIFLNRLRGFSHNVSLDANGGWMISHLPEYLKVFSADDQLYQYITYYYDKTFKITAENVNTLPNGQYADHFTITDITTKEEIYVPVCIDVDVPLTVNEQRNEVTLEFYRKADSSLLSHELRVVRDRYWKFTSFFGTEMETYFNLGRSDGYHNSVTEITLKDEYTQIGTKTFTFYCTSDNYIVKITITVTVEESLKFYPTAAAFLNQPNTINTINNIGNNTLYCGYALNAYRSDDGMSQRIFIEHLRHYVRALPTNLPVGFSLKYDPDLSTIGQGELSNIPSIECYVITVDLEKLKTSNTAGIYSTTLTFKLRRGTDTTDIDKTFVLYYSVPIFLEVIGNNQRPLPAPESEKGEYKIKKDYYEASTSVLAGTPYGYVSSGTAENT